MSEKPSYLKDNEWVDILGQRGKDAEPPKMIMAPENHAQTRESMIATGPLKGSRRNIQKRRLLVLRLAALGLDAEEIQQALASQGVTMGIANVYRDLSALRRQLVSVDKKNLDYSVAFAFAELTVLWREGWISYHNPDMQAGFLKLGALRELRNLHRSKTRLAGLDPGLGLSTEITAVVSPFFSGVKITTSTDIDNIVRDGGVEYAAIHQGNPRSND